MSAADLTEHPDAGMPRILRHCEVSHRDATPVADRLARALGSDLAARLVGALSRARR